MSATTPQDASSVPPAAPVGEILRSLRQRAGQDITVVAANLKIRASYLDAIEHGAYHELPGPAYALGFVRSYAEYLGLDTAEVQRRVKAEMDGQFRSAGGMRFVNAEQEGKVASLPLLLAGALVAGLVYGGWMFSNHTDQGMEIVPPLPDRLAALIRHGNDGADPAKDDAAGAPAGDNAARAGSSGTTTDVAPPPAETAPGGELQVVASTGAVLPPAGADAPAAVPADGSVPAQAPQRFVVRASQDSWLKVRDSRGKVQLATLVHAGRSLELPVGQGYRLSVGNAGALTLEADGQTIGQLGDMGRMRLDIPLGGDPQAMLPPSRQVAPAMITPGTPVPGPAASPSQKR